MKSEPGVKGCSVNTIYIYAINLMLNSVEAWLLIIMLKGPHLVCSPLVCYSFYILCSLMRHQKDSIKKKQNDDLIAPSIKKDLRVSPLILSICFHQYISFIWTKKVGWYLKSCSMFGSDFLLRAFFFKWSYHTSLSNHRLLKVYVIKKIRETALSTNNIIFYQNWLVHPVCLKYFVWTYPAC